MPVGAVGEILIEGPHLARDIWTVSARSRALDSYRMRPPGSKISTRLGPAHQGSISSGDLGRYTHAGTVEHLGRKDTLLKINGYRVEATEVEHILRQVVNPQGRSHRGPAWRDR